MTDGNRRLIPWLAEACKGARELTDTSQPKVAKIALAPRSRIARFEEGKTWPKNVEELVKAYAVATGYEDSRRLWRIAIGLWEQYSTDYPLDGAKPLAPEDLAGALDDYLRRKHEADSKGEVAPPGRSESVSG